MRAGALAAIASEPRIEVTSGIHNSPLGYWQFAEARMPDCADLVERIWYFDGMAAAARERAFPDGGMQIIVHFDRRYRDVHGAATVLCPEVCITGVQTRPMVIEAPDGRNAVMGVRLHPAGAYRLLARPLADTSGLTVDLHDLVGRAAADLAERCGEVRSAEARVRCAAQWVTDRLAHHDGVDPAVAWVTAQIERSGGRRRIEDLRVAAGLTKRRLLDTFRAQIGVTPKVYARIIRLRETLTLMHAHEAPLAEIAVIAGYYDQPHMNAEFRELCGMAPGDFLASARYSPTSAVA